MSGMASVRTSQNVHLGNKLESHGYLRANKARLSFMSISLEIPDGRRERLA